MDLGFKDKVVVITGGNSGMGQATAIMMADEGAKVVIAGRNIENNKATEEMIRARGGDCISVKCDVSVREDTQNMVDAAMEKYGRLDFAVNCAGLGGGRWMKPFLEHTDKDWDEVVSVNLTGTWMCMQAEVDAMMKSGGGAIVNVISIGGLIGFPHLTPYASSKSGIMGLTRTVALEYAQKGIRVNAICPGSFDTPIFRAGMDLDPEATQHAVDCHPMGRLGLVEEVAFAICALLSPKNGFMTGTIQACDGGWSQH